MKIIWVEENRGTYGEGRRMQNGKIWGNYRDSCDVCSVWGMYIKTDNGNCSKYF